MMQYLFQSINFRGDVTSKPYKDLLQGVGTEEISHVELIGTTIARLLDGSPQYNGKKTDPVDEPGAKGATPLKIALDSSNIHHYLVAAQGALPVDAAGNPWLGSYVYNSGNLVLDLLYNLMLESTGRLQKCRIYQMTENKAARSTIAYLIVRDQAHENAGFPMTIAPERREEFSPGLDKELLALIQATAEVEIASNNSVTK
jgi:Mn-containing catalase